MRLSVSPSKEFFHEPKKAWAAFFLLLSWCFIAILLFILQPGMTWGVIAAVYVLVTVIPVFSAMRCPYCSKANRGIRPFAENAGYCRYCGKTKEWIENS